MTHIVSSQMILNGVTPAKLWIGRNGLQKGYVDPTQFSSCTGFAHSYRTTPFLFKEKKRRENQYDDARDWAVAHLQFREIDVVILVWA